MNLRPPQPHCGALPSCATLRSSAYSPEQCSEAPIVMERSQRNKTKSSRRRSFCADTPPYGPSLFTWPAAVRQHRAQPRWPAVTFEGVQCWLLGFRSLPPTHTPWLFSSRHPSFFNGRSQVSSRTERHHPPGRDKNRLTRFRVTARPFAFFTQPKTTEPF